MDPFDPNKIAGDTTKKPPSPLAMKFAEKAVGNNSGILDEGDRVVVMENGKEAASFDKRTQGGFIDELMAAYEEIRPPAQQYDHDTVRGYATGAMGFDSTKRSGIFINGEDRREMVVVRDGKITAKFDRLGQRDLIDQVKAAYEELVYPSGYREKFNACLERSRPLAAQILTIPKDFFESNRDSLTCGYYKMDIDVGGEKYVLHFSAWEGEGMVSEKKPDYLLPRYSLDRESKTGGEVEESINLLDDEKYPGEFKVFGPDRKTVSHLLYNPDRLREDEAQQLSTMDLKDPEIGLAKLEEIARAIESGKVKIDSATLKKQIRELGELEHTWKPFALAK